MLAPPPTSLDAIHIAHSGRTLDESSDDDQDSSPQSAYSSPLSPATPFKRKRTASLMLCNGANDAEQLRAELDTTRRLLQETQARLEQAQQRAHAPLHECSICLEPIAQSAVGSCTHHFCHACLLHALATGATACPECRTPILEVRRDLEFDALLAPSMHQQNDAAAARIACYTRQLSLPPGAHAGITLASREGNGPGCVVVDVVKRDQAARCGLRRGDVLVSINGTPCTAPSRATAAIDQLTRTRSKETATLIVLPQIARE